MSQSNSGRASASTTYSNGRIQSLRTSIYSLALSVNTILPQYSASVSPTNEIRTSFEQDIWGETYRFQVLPEQRPSSQRQSSSYSRSSFESDRTALPPRYSTISPSYQHENRNQDLTVQHYEHSFLVQSKKPWATVFMFTPKSIPGMSRTSQAIPKVPVIYGEEPVLGMLELDIDSPKAIEQITISLQGRIWNGFSDVSTKFLDQTYLLWNKSSAQNRPTKDVKLLGSHQLPFSFQLKNATQISLGESNTVRSPGDTAVSPYEEVQSPASASSSKLSPVSTRPLLHRKAPSNWSLGSSNITQNPPGTSNFTPSQDTSVSPFKEMRSPVSASSSSSSSSSKVSPVSARSTFRSEKGQSARSSPNSGALKPNVGPDPLPPSFKEKGIPANVEYTLSIRIQRRLRPDNIIKTDVLYVPSTVAETISSKRKNAYATGVVAPGPYHDPEGWFALPNAIMKGEVNGQPIEIDCTLHIGEPRSYSRGTTIPCYLTFSSVNPHGLRLLCTPNTPAVRLTRRIRQFESRKLQYPASSSITPFRGEGIGEYYDECVLTKCTIVTVAMWRLPPKTVLESLDYNSCYLEGEIHLDEDLLPSYSSQSFKVEYHVELLPLISDIFKALPGEETKDGDGKGILSSSLVSIATLHVPEEPTPVKFSEPPMYGKFPEVQKEEPEWNNRSLEQFGLI